jgi:hypothetical protein
MGHRVVKGVRKRQLSSQDLAFAYFLLAKQAVRDRRAREAADKAKRRGKDAQ